MNPMNVLKMMLDSGKKYRDIMKNSNGSGFNNSSVYNNSNIHNSNVTPTLNTSTTPSLLTNSTPTQLYARQTHLLYVYPPQSLPSLLNQYQFSTLMTRRRQDPIWKSVISIRSQLVVGHNNNLNKLNKINSNISSNSNNNNNNNTKQFITINYHSPPIFPFLWSRAHHMIKQTGGYITPIHKQWIPWEQQDIFIKQLKYNPNHNSTTNKPNLSVEYTQQLNTPPSLIYLLYKLINFISQFHDQEIVTGTFLIGWDYLDRPCLIDAKKLVCKAQLKYDWNQETYYQKVAEAAEKCFHRRNNSSMEDQGSNLQQNHIKSSAMVPYINQSPNNNSNNNNNSYIGSPVSINSPSSYGFPASKNSPTSNIYQLPFGSNIKPSQSQSQNAQSPNIHSPIVHSPNTHSLNTHSPNTHSPNTLESQLIQQSIISSKIQQAMGQQYSQMKRIFKINATPVSYNNQIYSNYTNSPKGNNNKNNNNNKNKRNNSPLSIHSPTRLNAIKPIRKRNSFTVSTTEIDHKGLIAIQDINNSINVPNLSNLLNYNNSNNSPNRRNSLLTTNYQSPYSVPFKTNMIRNLHAASPRFEALTLRQKPPLFQPIGGNINTLTIGSHNNNNNRMNKTMTINVVTYQSPNINKRRRNSHNPDYRNNSIIGIIGNGVPPGGIVNSNILLHPTIILPINTDHNPNHNPTSTITLQQPHHNNNLHNRLHMTRGNHAKWGNTQKIVFGWNKIHME